MIRHISKTIDRMYWSYRAEQVVDAVKDWLFGRPRPADRPAEAATDVGLEP